MTAKTKSPGYVKAEQELDKLIAEHRAEEAPLYAKPYVPSEMPEPNGNGHLPPLADMTQRAGLPPNTVYGVNDELGELEYDVPADGTVQNVRKRQQPPEATGDEADLGPLTLEAYWEKARHALDLRDIALSDKARATSSKKAYDDAAKVVDQLGRQIREFGGFGKAKAETPPTLFDKGRVSDEEYEAFMGEERDRPYVPDRDDESEGDGE